jgi:hypothetical protein
MGGGKAMAKDNVRDMIELQYYKNAWLMVLEEEYVTIHGLKYVILWQITTA